MIATSIDTGTSALLAEMKNGVLTLTMNRPEARNALSVDMIEAMSRQLQWAAREDDVRCVLLTGAGKGFCSGGDVKDMNNSESAMRSIATDTLIQRQRLAQRDTAGHLYRMPKPTIAVLNGTAAGAGLSLALACDLRIMSSQAAMLTAFAKVGLSGDFGGTWFLSQLIGTAKARELYMLSGKVDAAEALRLGLANWICEPGELAGYAAETAEKLANGPTVAFRYIKENLNRAAYADLEDCMDLEATHHVHCMATSDHGEAVAAFAQKREPAFAGR